MAHCSHVLRTGKLYLFVAAAVSITDVQGQKKEKDCDVVLICVNVSWLSIF